MSRLPTPVVFAALLGVASAEMSARVTDAAVLGRAENPSGAAAQPSAEPPRIKRLVGVVSSSACDARYDPTKAQAEALRRLQARARARGGDGVSGVQFTQVTNTRSPCWHGVEATGLAVIYERP